MKKRKLLAILEEVYTAWEEFFAFAETVSTAAEFAFVWITSPFWVIPYTIYQKRKNKGPKACEDMMDSNQDIPDEMCKACLLQKLRQPAEEV